MHARVDLLPIAVALAVTLTLTFGCAGPPVWTPVPTPPSLVRDSNSTYFIQMADMQFGMWATPKLYLLIGRSGDPNSFERETENMELAIAHANRLRPDFVIVCGDLTNVPGHPGQIAEFKRIAARLDPEIPFYVVAGNHDVENAPTAESLATYRAAFGSDFFSFRIKDVYGIVLNSQLIHSPQNTPTEAEVQLTWLREELPRARASGAPQILIFQHHPYFLEDPNEDDEYFNIPASRRQMYLELLREGGVRAVFAGHYHRNAHGWDGELEMITNGPVGLPLGDDPSGLRIVRAGPGGLEHAYFSLYEVPAASSADPQ